jgi:hypothetical protein
MSMAKNSIIPDSGIAAGDPGSRNKAWTPAFAGEQGVGE